MSMRVLAAVVAAIAMMALLAAPRAGAQEPAPATAHAPAPPSAPTPLAESTQIGGCAVPAGYVEVTSAEAAKRGQRVFEAESAAHRLYVRADGSCVSLAAIPPLPDYAPEGEFGSETTAISDPPVAADADSPAQATSARPSTLPSTGTSSMSRDNAVLYAISIAATIALTAVILPVTVLALRPRA